MRAPHQIPSRASAGRVNLTPMIDVVFLLIIFFLVSSHLARQENRPPVELIATSTAAASNPAEGPLNVTIDSQNRVHLAGNILAAEQFAGALRRWLDTRPKDSIAVRLRVDRSVSYSIVEPILRELAKVGIADVSIATLRGMAP